MKICYTVINLEKEVIQLVCKFTFEEPILFRRIPTSNIWTPPDSYFDYIDKYSFSSKDILVSELIIISLKTKEIYSIFLYNKENPTLYADTFYVKAKYLPEFLERFDLI